MTQKIKINYTRGIEWPSSCASCRTNENLVAVQATSGKITSVSPIFIGAKISTELLNLNYPVCKTHANGLGLANLMTRKTLGLAFARGAIIFFGAQTLVMFLLTALDLILNLFTSRDFSFPDIPSVFVVIFLFFGLAFIYLLNAYRKIPIRILSQGTNDVMLKFKDDLYAKEFVRLNRHCIIK